MAREFTKVFVSYARRDFYLAEQLAVALRRHDVAAWFDGHELASGTDWSAGIEQAIAGCDAMVLVASPAALESPYVRSEYSRAVQRGRPVVAVRCSKRSPPQELNFPIYDLRCSFRRGVAALADDLVGRHLYGRVCRGLPFAVGPFLVALAPALSLVCGVVVGLGFLRAVVGHIEAVGPNVMVALVAAGVLLGLLTGVAAYTLTAFLRRRISWRYLRGSFLTLPLLALSSAVQLDTLASYLTDPIAAAMGATDSPVLGVIPTAVALLVLPTCVAAGFASEFSAGLCRFLRTGAAPQRIRVRHLGSISTPVAHRPPTRRIRIHAAPIDDGVAQRLKECLAVAGVFEAADNDLQDRDIVVVSDATPAAWLERSDLRDPIAVVATSISLSLRGALGRFQWVDHRRRRPKTLRLLAGTLAGTGIAGPSASLRRPLAEVPERLQLLRLPAWVAVTEWMLFCLGVIAAQVAAYGWTRVALDSWRSSQWPACLCAVVVPIPFLLARQLRQRQIALVWLAAAVAAFWVLVIGLGADAVFQALYPFYDRGNRSAVTIVYPVLSALMLAIAARPLLRWLPKQATRLRTAKRVLRVPTLGSVSGSWAWLAIMVPALGTAIATALL